MLPIVPSALPPKEEHFKEVYKVTEENGKHLLEEQGQLFRVGDFGIERLLDGSFEGGFKYTLKFLECQEICLAKVQVKKIAFDLVGENFTASAECGETIVDNKNFTIQMFLKSEETRRILPLTEGEELKIYGRIVYGNSWGLRVYRTITYDFAKVNDDSSIAFAFSDEKILYANLDLLMMHSHYFKTLSVHLYQLPKDEKSGLPLLTLDDHPSSAFETILRIVYPSVNEKCPFMRDIGEVLRLAEFLCFDYVLVKFEKWLLDDDEHRFATKIEKIFLAAQYSMGCLLEYAIGELKDFSDVEKLKEDSRFDDLPKEVMSKLVGTLLKMNQGINE